MNIVDFLKFLFYISIIVWLIPPIRNYKGKFFYYFVFLAISDPISIILRELSIPSRFISYLFVGLSFCYLLSIISKEEIAKYKYFIIASFLFIVLLNIVVNKNYMITLSYIAIHWIIFMIFLKYFITSYVERIFNFFFFMLMFYELTIISKYLAILTEKNNATAFFIIATIFQIAFGLFFSIFREDKTGIVLKRG